MNDLSGQLRERIFALLPPKAFLRRDRLDALYVSNAPRLVPEKDWIATLKQSGFIAWEENRLLKLLPSSEWLLYLENQYEDPPDFLCKSLIRFKKLPPEYESLKLSVLGIRSIEGDPCARDYEKRLRQRIAVCLRNGGGGGLYACGILNYIIKEENPHEAEMARSFLL